MSLSFELWISQLLSRVYGVMQGLHCRPNSNLDVTSSLITFLRCSLQLIYYYSWSVVVKCMAASHLTQLGGDCPMIFIDKCDH